MTDTEFLDRLPEGSRKPTDREFELIQFVYNYHPSIHPVEGKKQIAMLYSTFGMRIILDMEQTAMRAKALENERRTLENESRTLKSRLQELEREQEELAMI